MGKMTSPPILVLEMARKLLGTLTAAVCITCWVTLRKIFIMPSVAMKAGSLLRAINTPLMPPSRQPKITPATMPMA